MKLNQNLSIKYFCKKKKEKSKRGKKEKHKLMKIKELPMLDLDFELKLFNFEYFLKENKTIYKDGLLIFQIYK